MQESRKRLKTKRIIQEALIELLQEQAFNQISTVHLTKQAKISRSSFYTHYRDKYDLIDRYQRDLFQQFEYIFETYGEDKREAIIRTLKLVREERLVTALLSENGTKEIQNFLRHKLQILMDEDLRVRYGDKTFTPAETRRQRRSSCETTGISPRSGDSQRPRIPILPASTLARPSEAAPH